MAEVYAAVPEYTDVQNRMFKRYSNYSGGTCDPLPINLGNFDKDRWQLFNTDADRAEAVDLADEHPEIARD